MEQASKYIKIVVVAVLVVVCLFLVISGQKSVTYTGTAKMLIGLCGILVLMFAYNKQYT